MTNIFIGLMSGTSIDAIDAVALDSELHIVASITHDIPEDLQTELHQLSLSTHDEIERLGVARTQITHEFAEATCAILNRVQINSQANNIQGVSCFGQTIRHRPDHSSTDRFTLQLLDGALLAKLSSLPVTSDFRLTDMANGGQGAPLAPPFHQALIQQSGIDHTKTAVVNLGGIGNISVFTENRCHGWDTGPANTLLDAWMQSQFQRSHDAQGATASNGSVIDLLLDSMLDEPFFQRNPPKSTGRELFSHNWLQSHLKKVDALTDSNTFGNISGNSFGHDVAATLTELTARSVAQSLQLWNKGSATKIDQIYLCGGGAYNDYLVKRIQHACQCSVATTATLGIEPQWIEAALVGWYGHKRWNKQSVDLTGVTGSSNDQAILGSVFLP